MRPLEGIKILDFSTLLPGPMASLILAEAGANVVKIERPGSGEEMRAYQPTWGASGVNFALLNRGKKSVVLDLKSDADRARLMPLVESADVLLEQFRPGVMDRLGLGYECLRKRNPGLIYCSVTGYGHTGPKASVAGHDLNYIGDSGLLHLSMGTPDHPVIPPALIADIAGGAYPAVINILLALSERQTTGRGRFLDVAMADNLFPFMYWAIGNGTAANQWPGNGTDLVTGGTPRYHLYVTSDDKFVAAAPIEQKFWDAFCTIVGLEEDLRDDRLNPAATTARLCTLIRSAPADHWALAFAGKDCCCSVVADIKQAINDPHFIARGLFRHTLVNEEGAVIPALPLPIDAAFRASPKVPVSAPSLGAHNEEFFGARGSRS